MTLTEQVMAAFLIGFLVLVWVNSIRVTTKGTVQSKNNLRAQNLALAKLEDVKNLAIQSSLSHRFAYVTYTPMVISYGNTQVAQLENRAFTWRVTTFYFDDSYITGTATSVPPALTYTSHNVGLLAWVGWNDVTGVKSLTMTGYVTDIRQ